MADTRKHQKTERRGGLRFILICLAVSAVLAAAVILSAREIFALGASRQTGESVEIEFAGETALRDVAVTLKRNGLVGSGTLFRLYSAIRGKSGAVAAGKYELSPSSGYDGLLFRLRGGGTGKRTQVSVTLPEGCTVRDILRIVCDEKGICSREELIGAIQKGDFSHYSFVRELDEHPREGRLFRLEGYLYPDTYYFYSDSSGEEVVEKMLENFDSHFDGKYLESCKKNGMTVNEAVTLASMITKEARYISDYPKVSSVFRNRKNSKSFGGRYQSDATLTYALGRPMQGGDKDDLSPYNTYKYKGLPPSPICNPDMNAVSYALCPDKTSYYYFFSGKDGNTHYATAYDEHRRNIVKYG